MFENSTSKRWRRSEGFDPRATTGTKEAHNAILTSESAVMAATSSLSFSPAGEDDRSCDKRGEEKEIGGGGCDRGPSSFRKNGDRNVARSSRRQRASVVPGAALDNGLLRSSTTTRASSLEEEASSNRGRRSRAAVARDAVVEGRLIARTLPRMQDSDYEARKPSTRRVDPAPFVASLRRARRRRRRGAALRRDADDDRDDEDIEDDSTSAHDADETISPRRERPEEEEDESSSAVVVLDLYLFRVTETERADRAPRTSAIEDADSEEYREESRQGSRERRVRSTMSAFDVARSRSGRDRNSGKSCERRDLLSSEKENVLFRLHMKRSSNESAARTLRRLELSTARKLQALDPLCCRRRRHDGGGSDGCSKKESHRGNTKERDLEAIVEATSSKLVLLEKTAQEERGGGDAMCTEVDLRGRSAADALRAVSESGERRGDWAVELTVPKAILPWSANDDVDVDNDEISTSGEDSADSATKSVFEELETVRFAVTSNPPTLLSVSTFENFAGELFVGVPTVVETRVIHATRAVVVWFVDGRLASYDCRAYTPTAADVGRRISILVTPVRLPDHDGEGCEEAYSFRDVVKPLPPMPVVELREEWCRRRGGGEHAGVRSVVRNDDLRVVTYNILADLYTGRNKAEEHNLYGHCDIGDLSRQRRMPMVVAEILSYGADVVCLQEVDAAVHDLLLRPVLEASGYQGFYSNKASSQQEGCSMFWSTATFKLAAAEDMRTFPLRSLLTKKREGGIGNGGKNELSRQSTHYYDSKSAIGDFEELERWESMDGITDLFDNHEEVRKVFEESVGQIVQIVRLSPKRTSQGCTPNPENIVVANTHLFYHPMADHIRVLQAYAVCRKLDEIRRERQCPDPVLICGDFNSSPLSGAVRLLTHRTVLPSENDCWRNLNVYRWECGDSEYMIDHGYNCDYNSLGKLIDPCYIDEEFFDARSDETPIGSHICNESAQNDSTNENAMIPPTIELPSSFPVLASGCLKVPQFTNYAVDFTDTLDYVFASKPSEHEPFGFRPKGEAPMLTEDMVTKYVAMPNEVMPSDHLAIVCDFEWMER